MIKTDLSPFSVISRYSERFRLQLRAEGFNMSEHAAFNNPGANVSNMRLAADGTISNLGNFLSITSARPDQRSFRFALRLEF